MTYGPLPTACLLAMLIFWSCAPGWAFAQPPIEPTVTDAATALAAQLTEEGKRPAVAAIVSLHPTDPADLIDGVLTLSALRADATAQRLLDQLLQIPLDEAAQAQLARRVGTADLLRMMRNRTLRPRAEAFAAGLIDAAARAARDPALLERLVADLASPEPAVRIAAMADLMAAQTAGAAYCLGALADPDQAAIHGALLDLLTRQGATAEGPVLAALETSDPEFRARVYTLVGRVGLIKALPLLIGPAMGPPGDPATQAAGQAAGKLLGRSATAAQAEAYLLSAIDEALAGTHPYLPDHQGQVELWQWDDATRTATPHKLAHEDVGPYLAERMARGLAAAWPEHRLLHGALVLELAKRQTGYGSPISLAEGAGGLVAALDPQTITGILNSALQRGLIGGATAACEILSEERVIAGADPSKLAPALALAMNHGDRRLKFAAMLAILRLAPSEPFVGAGQLPGTLGYFASSEGELVVLAAHPRIERAVQIAGKFEQLGYHGQIATTGRDLIEAAQSSADVSLMLLDMNISDPLPSEILHALRHGRRTSRLPVGLVVSANMPPAQLDLADRLATGDPLTSMVLRPLELGDAEQLERELLSLAGREALALPERLAQSRTALEWMERLVRERNEVFDVRGELPVVLDMAYLTELRPRVLGVLGVTNLPAAQVALADLASDPFIDLPGRTAAGAAFAVNVARHGILLTREEMLRQYDRYNDTPQTDLAAKTVLSSILDTLEGREPARPGGP